jgi:hypothetical protein
LSDTKLGHEGRITAGNGRTNQLRNRLLRQFGSALVVALLACAVMSLNPLPVSATYQNPQDPPEPEQDKDKDKEKSKEIKKSPFSKDVQNIKEYDLPETQLKEYFKGTRSHRKQDPGLIKEDVRDDAPKPTAEEHRKFDELRKQNIIKDEDIAIIDKVAKRQVYSLSQPQRDWYLPGSEGRKSRDAIETMLETGGGATERFLTVYKQSLLNYLPDLLNNHIWVRVNAMKLLAKMRDERPIKLFCDQIQDSNQHESVKFMAMEGIEALGQKRLITQVNLETLAIQTLLDVLAKPDQFHPFTRQQAVRAIGAICRPNRVVGGNDVDVAIELLKIVRDPNIRRADRAEAAVLLANLNIPAQADYNYQYVAYEIGQFAADVGAAAANDPATDDLHSDLYLVDASYALVAEKRPDKSALFDRARKSTASSAKADPAYIRSIGDHVTKLTVEALKIYKPDVVTTKTAPGKATTKQTEDVFKRAKDVRDGLQGSFSDRLVRLNDFLKSTPPRSMKLTPMVEELGPPPSLAKSKTESAEEAANGAESSSRSDPN